MSGRSLAHLPPRKLPAYIQNSCRKQGYKTAEAAQTAIARIAARTKPNGNGKRRQQRSKTRPVRAYQCPDCKLWHLSSKPAWGPA